MSKKRYKYYWSPYGDYIWDTREEKEVDLKLIVKILNEYKRELGKEEQEERTE